MWLVEPKLMCNRHLVSEHFEMHCFVGSILRGRSIDGYIRNGLVEVGRIRDRHDELVEEMHRRGYIHVTPLPAFESWEAGLIDVDHNLSALSERCPECRSRQEGLT